MLRSLFRILSPGPAREFAVANRLTRNMQGRLKNVQERHHLQDRHCAFPCSLMDTVSVSLGAGIAQPARGTWDPDRRRRSIGAAPIVPAGEGTSGS